MTQTVTLRRVTRRSPVLSPSSLACLSTLPTINLTAGCAHGCAYCYIQGYSFYPGRNAVALYDNTLTQLKDELRRAMRRPAAVYFSPSSDLFQPVPDVLAMAHDVLEVLLGEGIGVSILTKGLIPPPTFELLARHADLVRMQVGVITVDEALTARFEPNTPTPAARIEQMQRLVAAGIPVEARLDPILPGVTDGAGSLWELFDRLAGAGIRHAAAGILFLRPAIAGAMRRAAPDHMLSPLLSAYQTRHRMTLRGGSPVFVDSPPREVRAESIARRSPRRHPALHCASVPARTRTSPAAPATSPAPRRRGNHPHSASRSYWRSRRRTPVAHPRGPDEPFGVCSRESCS